MISQTRNIFFCLIILILSFQINSNFLRKEFLQIDDVNIECKKKEGNSTVIDGKLKLREEEMMKKATEGVSELPIYCSWNKFVKDMGKRFGELKKRGNVTKEELELFAYEFKVITLDLMKKPKTEGTGGDCDKFARYVMGRTNLLIEDKTVDSFENIDNFIESNSGTCKVPSKELPKCLPPPPAPKPVPVPAPKPKPVPVPAPKPVPVPAPKPVPVPAPKPVPVPPKECHSKKKVVEVFNFVSSPVRRFVTIEEGITDNC
jgi:hypothetical protein